MAAGCDLVTNAMKRMLTATTGQREEESELPRTNKEEQEEAQVRVGSITLWSQQFLQMFCQLPTPVTSKII